MLDLVSNGRVEFGSGESSSEAELAGFQIDPCYKRDMWHEGLAVALRCMTETPFTGVQGKYVTMPPRNVVPKPVQKPHPPLWVACWRRDTISPGRREGHRLAHLRVHRPRRGALLGARLRATLSRKCVPVGERVNANVACVTPIMCHDDEEAALRRGLEGAQLLRLLARPLLRVRRPHARLHDVWQEFVANARRARLRPRGRVLAGGRERGRLGAKVVAGDTAGLRGATGTPEPDPRVPPNASRKPASTS